MENVIQLGDKVEDIVTGFKGIAVQRIEYLNGCVQFSVKPKVDKEGKKVSGEWFDYQQLKVVRGGLNKPAPKPKPRRTGGPSSDAPDSYRG